MLGNDGKQRRNLLVRGRASRKFRRAPATGQAQAKRVAFGHTWGEINASIGKQLRQREK